MKKTDVSRRRLWVLGSISAFIVIAAVLSHFISSERLRRIMEDRMNKNLKGYSVSIERAYFHPIGFSIDLENLILVQNAEPDPPIANIRNINASVHWRELLRARLAGDFLIDHPSFHLDLNNIRKERESKVPLKEKGWQESLQSIYPLKINVFRINDGELTYVDEGPYKPLKLDKINLHASNIRNIRSPGSVYPSHFRMEGLVFGKGKLSMNGQADFLQQPHPGIKSEIDLKNMDLSYFEPIVKRRNVSVSKGTLSAMGNVEYAPAQKILDLKTLDIQEVNINYLRLPQTTETEKQRLQKAVEKAEELSNEPTTKIRVDTLTIKGAMGYINRTTEPNYRLFIDDVTVTVSNFSNQFAEGEATLEMAGKFMGSGDTVVKGTFRPESKQPDFDLDIAIVETQMPPMSNLFRAYGNFDIKAGLFSFFSELRIKGGEIDGYVKPLFKNMEVYDRRSEQEKSLFQKLYIAVVRGITGLLENPRQEVATRTDISGPVTGPETDTFETVINLIRNAFIQSILPGFEEEVSRPE
jgi:hypothetical protein